MDIRDIRLGAVYLENNLTQFNVWAPFAQKVEIHLVAPRDEIFRMQRDKRGYHWAKIEGLRPGNRYFFRLDDKKEYPDPSSRYQPEGVHGPSQIVDSVFTWEDSGWRGLPVQDYILYELHVGSFTEEGTFEAVVPLLDNLARIGVNAVELMPVAQYSGSRNWGYDGVYPFSVQNSYGGPEGLKHLVNACHCKNIAVVLDVVYNHIGPEGNYLGQFGPYYTDRYRTPWGQALNFDGPQCDHVRRFFIENAQYWFTEFHVDALRLDALHAIYDSSSLTFLEELANSISQLRCRLGRRLYLIGESDSNNRRLLLSPGLGGYGLDAQWNDDFHHSLFVLLTGEKTGYYQDFGHIKDLAKAFREGFVYSGQYSSFRQRRHGSCSVHIPARRFIAFAQNHDQVGNRMLGERLGCLVSFEGLKLAAGVVIFSPFIPLLFMGEEYGETAPFQYFTSHSDPDLIEAVRTGRAREFSAFNWQGEVPDPQDPATFLRSKLSHNLADSKNRTLYEFYARLIRLRRETPALRRLSKETLEVYDYEKSKVLLVRRWTGSNQALTIFCFNQTGMSVTLPVPFGHWHKKLDSADVQWQGNGSRLTDDLNSDGKASLSLEPVSFALFTCSKEI